MTIYATYDVAATKEHLIWPQSTHTLNGKHARAYYVHVTLWSQSNRCWGFLQPCMALKLKSTAVRVHKTRACAYTLYYVKLILNHYLGS